MLFVSSSKLLYGRSVLFIWSGRKGTSVSYFGSRFLFIIHWLNHCLSSTIALYKKSFRTFSAFGDHDLIKYQGNPVRIILPLILVLPDP